MWTERLIGVLLLGLGATLGLAGFSQYIPDSAGQFVSMIVRVFDSLRLHLLLGVIVLSALLWTLGEGRIALAGLVCAGIIAVLVIVDTRARASSPGPRADLSVLWFNMLESNEIPDTRLAEALTAADVDILILAESTPMAATLPGLMQETHPHVLECPAESHCGLLLLSRVPLAFRMIRDLSSGEGRLLRVTYASENHPTVHLIGAHLVKPWYTGFSDTDMEALEAALDAKVPPPLILTGDFNAAPWSRRLRGLSDRFALKHAPWPLATWPAKLGRWGVPIDHMLVGGGVELHRIATWGQGLGSNHLGLRAEFTLPDKSPPSQ